MGRGLGFVDSGVFVPIFRQDGSDSILAERNGGCEGGPLTLVGLGLFLGSFAVGMRWSAVEEL